MRAVGAAAVVVASLAVPASAGAADYGGGTAPESVSRAERQMTLVGIRTSDNGRARITVTVPAGCGTARLLHRVQLNADGTFAFNVTLRHRVREDRRILQRARVSMSGQVVGATASGTASARIVQRRGGRVRARCNSGARTWQVRAAAADAQAG